MTKEEIQNIYDYSKSKTEIIKKLNIRINQNGYNIDKDILVYFSKIGITTREQISSKKINQHWLEIQKRDYELNPKYCLNCGKKIPFEKRYLKCCNQSCANSYSNKLKGPHTEETKQKISQSIKKGIEEHRYILKNGYGEYNYGIRTFICQYCGKEIISNKYHKFCSDECRHNSASEKAKALRKKEIENGTFQGWKTRNITSYAEKFWKQVLDNNNIPYIREKLFEYGNSGKGERYFLDFYIEINNRKIDLEIDGKQHKYEERKEKDIIRDQYIKESGIEVYRIDWNEINSEQGSLKMKEKIDKFLDFIKQ